MHLLSRSEEIVLVAIWKLKGNAYGVTIRNLVNDSTGYDWSVGAVYAPLHRLEKKGLVKTLPGDPIPERGGRSKRIYRLTKRGERSLLEIRNIQETMWAGVSSIQPDTEKL